MTDKPIPTADGEVTATHNRPMLPVLSKFELLEDHADIERSRVDLIARAKKVVEDKPDVAAWTDDDDATVAALGGEMVAFQKTVGDAHKRTKAPYLNITNAIDSFFNKDNRDALEPHQKALGRLAGARGTHRANLERARLQKIAADAKKAEEEALSKAAALETEGKNVVAGVALSQAEHASGQAEVAEARATHSTVGQLSRTTTAGGNMGARRNLEWTVDRDTVDLEKLRQFLPLDAFKTAITQFNRTNGNKVGPDGEPAIAAPIKGVVFTAVAIGTFR